MNYRDPRRSREFAPWVNALKGRSGVYVFRSAVTGRALYVGESHTGNLDRTIKRHFWDWRDGSGKHHYTVGLFFPVEVAVKVMPARYVLDAQSRLILRLEPAHNRQTPTDTVPF